MVLSSLTGTRYEAFMKYSKKKKRKAERKHLPRCQKLRLQRKKRKNYFRLKSNRSPKHLIQQQLETQICLVYRDSCHR